MTPMRLGTYAGLVCTMPAAVWLLASIKLTAGSHSAVLAASLQAVEALALLNTLVAIVAAPWLTRARRWGEGLGGMVMLALVPLPILTVAWLTGAVAAGSLLRIPLGVLGLGACTYFVMVAVIRSVRPDQGRPLAVVFVQAAGCALLWMGRDLWWDWLV